jgi:sec-independent protein translocase protein TatC
MSESNELDPGTRAATAPPGSVARDSARETLKPTSVELAGGGGGGRPPNSGSGGGDDGGGGDDDEENMVKMSFLEHLEELRRRLINAIIAVAVGMGICLFFSEFLYNALSRPILDAMRELKIPPTMYFSHPSDAFDIYLQIGLICGLFLASPFVMGQVWGFISPGLYQREKKYAMPFVTVCSGLFISGGAFGYFIAFPYALKFLLGLGNEHLQPMIMGKEYLDLMLVIILGLGITFELPILILILSLLHVVTPKFLLDNFRYAVLIITIIAAVVTPTTDIMNMMVFEVPMLLLYLLGVFFAWLVVKNREKKKKEQS